MDTRGIEVTNQLRSAIRAKLNELGVRYDEELPDYILVMVVNKKSRQQMHDDLNLFLEDCTTIFVDWLHDQVLKKLQKVTIAKKKSSREFVPTVVVKQEEEKRKRKISATSFLEDQTVEQLTVDKSLDKNAKIDKQQSVQKLQTIKPSVSNQNLEQSCNKSGEKNVKSLQNDKTRTDEVSTHSGESYQESACSDRRQQSLARDENVTKENVASENCAAKTANTHREQRSSEAISGNKSLKRSLETSSNRRDSTEKRDNEKRPKPSEDEEREDAAASSSSDTVSRKLKSCVNKPKITSIVSVKNRLGIASPRKKFEIYREKEGNGRSRPLEKLFEKSHRYDNNRSKSRNFEVDDRNSRRNRDGESSRHHDQMNRLSDVRSRIESNKNERLNKNVGESREKIPTSGSNIDISGKKTTCTVKDRLGIAGINNKTQKQSAKSQETLDYQKNSKSSEQFGNSIKNIKARLGPARNNFKPVLKRRRSRESENDKSTMPTNLGDKEEEEEQEGDGELENDEQSLLTGPVKSRIVAVNRSVVSKTERKRFDSKIMHEVPFNAKQYSAYGNAKSNKMERGAFSDADDVNMDDTRLPSKVIVTPRPLKPLQPTQKRATQSLLLRAVAEANQSVVTQKNPEPSLLDKKPVFKRLKPTPARDVSQNLSVHFNSNKRLVMEKIQVELNTVDNLDTEDVEPCAYSVDVPQAVTDEHIGVVMSLFQRSDDKQKFLVTLNGYNNNLMKEKMGSEDEEEQLEMEVNEEDELALLTTHSETYAATMTMTTTTTTTMTMTTSILTSTPIPTPTPTPTLTPTTMTITSALTSTPTPTPTPTLTPTPIELEAGVFRITMDGMEDYMEDVSPKGPNGENNENCNAENMDKFNEAPRRRRKLSPIIYNRSHSPSPTRLKSTALLSTLVTKLTDKKLENTGMTGSDKSRENCRYWPNCTLGNKCAFLHLPVMCSAFPTCKFGDKCAYKHPKCKFGLSCTKLGCVFSHLAQQCKYHPFCTKPACPYSHPVICTPATEVTNQRAKFTWRRRD